MIEIPQSKIEYILPVENSKDVYLNNFGMFFAPRPGGRPHLGLDIWVNKNPYRKPKEPIEIISPVDGVVIAHKRAREKDNVVANSITILGVDGRRYAFDHMARATDYNDSIPMPNVGSIIAKGDAIGYVGKTGETDLWHLHFAVMTDEELEFQQNDEYWLKLNKQTGYAPLKGQVDPLDKEKAGPITDLLNGYLKK